MIQRTETVTRMIGLSTDTSLGYLTALFQLHRLHSEELGWNMIANGE